MKQEYKQFVQRIAEFVDRDRIYTDDLRCLAWGTDAGFYRHLPQVVVRSCDEQEVSRLLAIAHEMCLPVTFRAAGTSLSGQTVTDSILIVAGKHWERYSISDDASTITLQPGLVGAKVDQILAPLGGNELRHACQQRPCPALDAHRSGRRHGARHGRRGQP